MCIQLIRTFHAVGQGAFYSERFRTPERKIFNMVYDCGALPKSKAINKIIKGSFNSDEEIDILFISHFDSDHVNGIDVLKNSVKKIKNVVLPLLSDKEKQFLIAIYSSLGDGYKSVVNLIGNPRDYFGKETNIITVKAIEIDDTSPTEPIEIDSFSSGQIISSGTPIIFKNTDSKYFWIYKPYNYKFTERNKQIFSELSKRRIAKDNLNNPEFINNKENQKIIRDLYRKIDGNINENSMIVYSNSMNEFDIVRSKFHRNNLLFYHSFYCRCYGLGYASPGCIFTGDANLKKIKFDFFDKIKNDNYSKLDSIGTIQVAHHGSYKNFDIDFFNNFKSSLICPISFGTKNTYGHPSDFVLSELLLNEHHPVCVSDLRGNSFFQLFEMFV